MMTGLLLLVVVFTDDDIALHDQSSIHNTNYDQACPREEDSLVTTVDEHHSSNIGPCHCSKINCALTILNEAIVI